METLRNIKSALLAPDFDTDEICTLSKEELANLTPQQLHEEALCIFRTYCRSASGRLPCKNPDGDTPALFVTTYGKYNDGRQFYASTWLDLYMPSSFEEFDQIARAINYDDRDPEIMCTDYQNFPEGWYSESPDREDIEKIIEFARSAFGRLQGKNLSDDDDREMWEAYIDATGDDDATFKQAQDNFVGKYEDDETFAEGLFRECYDIPDHLDGYIDWERVARDIMMDHYAENGYYFHA